MSAPAGAHLDAPDALGVELGCRPGNISFRLAERLPGVRVVGIDGAAVMLAVAERRLAAMGPAGGRLSFACHTLPSAALEQGPLAAAG